MARVLTWSRSMRTSVILFIIIIIFAYILFIYLTHAISHFFTDYMLGYKGLNNGLHTVLVSVYDRFERADSGELVAE